jgi:hypothetical protein
MVSILSLPCPNHLRIRLQKLLSQRPVVKKPHMHIEIWRDEYITVFYLPGIRRSIVPPYRGVTHEACLEVDGVIFGEIVDNEIAHFRPKPLNISLDWDGKTSLEGAGSLRDAPRNLVNPYRMRSKELLWSRL